MRAPTTWRGALTTFALLALTLKLLMPPGFMPGNSLSTPIMLCPGQGAMPMAAHQSGHDPAPMHHGAPEHQCAFAGLGAAALAAPFDPPAPIAALIPADPVTPTTVVIAPGHGLAAPPPPSHAPPALRA